MNEKIQALLYSIGITGNYIGFYQAASAIEIAICDPQSLLMLTKKLYSDVAKQYKTDWKTVERNIRTVISIAWKYSQRKLETIAGRSLAKRPTPAQFISILSCHLQGLNCA